MRLMSLGAGIDLMTVNIIYALITPPSPPPSPPHPREFDRSRAQTTGCCVYFYAAEIIESTSIAITNQTALMNDVKGRITSTSLRVARVTPNVRSKNTMWEERRRPLLEFINRLLAHQSKALPSTVLDCCGWKD